MTVGSRSTNRARGTCLLLAVSLKNVPNVLPDELLWVALRWAGGSGPDKNNKKNNNKETVSSVTR